MIIPLQVDQEVFSYANDELNQTRIVKLIVTEVKEQRLTGWRALTKYIDPATGELEQAAINEITWNCNYFSTPQAAICDKIERQKKHLNDLEMTTQHEEGRLRWLYGLLTAADEKLLSYPTIL